jgi:hypothetical protein
MLNRFVPIQHFLFFTPVNRSSWYWLPGLGIYEN